MKKYLIAARYLAVSQSGIHLMRNGFSFETIPYNVINNARIARRYESDNWFLAILFGLFILGLGIYLSWGLLNILVNGTFAGSYKFVFMLLIPFCGLYFVAKALRRGPVIMLSYGKRKSVCLPIRDIIDRGEYLVLLNVLSKTLGDRLDVRIQDRLPFAKS